MASSLESTAFDRGVTPILTLVLPERAASVVNFRPDAALQDRIEQLADKANEGELTAEEQAEYAGYVRANKFVAILKRQAQRHLPGSASGHE
jgi:hypothetical protein